MRDFVVQSKPLTKDQLIFLYKKVLKFIIEDSQPFYILESNSFKELLLSLHPFFELPTEEALDKLLDNSFETGQIQLRNIFENVNKVSLTTDFWTSRGQHGYIGVTAHWISDDYKPKEAFLTLQHVHYPHTSEVIKDKLEEIIINWNISNKVTFITTDNAASMVKSIRLLKDDFDIERISCAAHTLQLVIGKALTCDINIQIFILRVKRIVHYFSSPKQLEHLVSAQEQLNYSKIYKTVKDTPTRWNSSFYSWKRLLLLKGALVYLPNKLKADHIKENTKDGKRLERIMLNEEEWKFMEDLVIILKEFEEITRVLGGSKYVTLSLIYPLILKLKDFIRRMLENYQNNENENNQIIEILLNDDNVQNEILEEFEEIPDDEIADTIEINEKGTKHKLNISRPVKTKGLVLLFLKALEGSLNKYWTLSSGVGLLATLLDPRSKKLIRFSTTEQQEATTLLIKKYETHMLENKVNNTENDENEGNEEDEGDADDFNLEKSLMDSIFGEEENCDEENEVDEYLKLKQAKNTINPLFWWQSNETKFPILSKLAKELFGISATSVPSERLFSDVGNVITNKRSSLKPEKVEKLIFLKRNAYLLDIL